VGTAGTARVHGVVIDAETGQPLPFATVNLDVTPGSAFGRQSVVTAEDGTFDIADVRAGTYTLTAAKPGYPVMFYRRSGGASPDSGDPLGVRAGEQIGGLEIRLVRGGVIAGRVLEPGGEPAVGAAIKLYRVDAPPRPRTIFSPIEMFRTNARGEYRLWGLAPGDYLVAASALSPSDGWYRGDLVYGPVWFPDANDAGQAQRISVSAGQVRDGIDFHVALVKPVTVSGIVVGAANLGAGWISVDARARDLTAPGLRGVEVSSVDASGRFALRGVLPGDYWVRASRYPRDPGSDQLDPAWGIVQVSVTDADVKGVVVPLQPWLSISGRVRVESSVPGMDASRLRIAFRTTENSLFDAFAMNLAIDASGTFAATRLAPGRYRLDVAPQVSGVIVTIKTLEIGGRPVSPEAIALEPGENLSDVVIDVDVRPVVP
jgi:hypothetical protein